MKFEQVSIEKMKHYENNPRKNEKAVPIVAQSIAEYDFLVPVVLDKDNMIVCGHTRVKAVPEALNLIKQKIASLTDADQEQIDILTERYNRLNEGVPAIYAENLTEDQIKAFRIMENKTQEYATWDLKLLQNELIELKMVNIDLSNTGIPETELNRLLQETNEQVKGNNPPKYQVKMGDIYQLGRHMVRCGDSTKPETYDFVKEVDLIFTDPPYGVSYTGQIAYDIANPEKGNGKKWEMIEGDDLRGDKLYDFLKSAFTEANKKLKNRGAFYCFYASRNHMIFEKALNDSGLIVKQILIWNKHHVLGRSDYHWCHEPCQPAGTLVRKVINPKATAKGKRGAFAETKEVPIETLKDGDLVVSYEPRGCVVHTRGRRIKTAKRQYDGEIVQIKVGGKATKTTDTHKFTVRMNNPTKDTQVIYLMRKGNWWRIGQVKLFNSRGFGLASRLKDEQGDEAWIITTAQNTLEARMLEQALSCKYNIPTTHWSIDKYSHKETQRDKELIKQIYEIVGLERINQGAMNILKDYHRKIAYPLIKKNQITWFSRKMSRIVESCNLVPTIMELPIPTKGEEFKWEPINEINYNQFSGEVYSLDVDRDEHYIADGIITHNCMYGHKVNDNCNYYGDRLEKTILNKPLTEEELSNLSEQDMRKTLKIIIENSDLWTIKKDNAMSYIHPTQKPIGLAKRAIINSCPKGGAVLEPFGGSGSTLMACEELGRPCYLIEFSPEFVSHILERWEKFTGKTAIKIFPQEIKG